MSGSYGRCQIRPRGVRTDLWITPGQPRRPLARERERFHGRTCCGQRCSVFGGVGLAFAVVSSQHGVQQPARWRVVLAWAIVCALGVAAAVLLVPRFVAGEPVGPTSNPVAVVPSASPSPTVSTAPSPSPTATPTPTPAPTPTPTESRTETVLFQGGPATGPWQQLGTVAEINHPGAPESASYSWRTFWSDPAEENQPDALWDQLVIEVTDQLVALGEPVNRPAFGGAEGSEPFNSFGGIQDIYPDERVFTASWNAVYADSSGTWDQYFWFIVSFEGEVLQRMRPVPFAEADGRTVQTNTQEAGAEMRLWAESMGYSTCVLC